MFASSNEVSTDENVTYCVWTVKESSSEAQLQEAQMLRPGRTACPPRPMASLWGWSSVTSTLQREL